LGGSPASAASLARTSEALGVLSDGLTRHAFPHAAASGNDHRGICLEREREGSERERTHEKNEKASRR
jgi:hypothetical protein